MLRCDEAIVKRKPLLIKVLDLNFHLEIKIMFVIFMFSFNILQFLIFTCEHYTKTIIIIIIIFF